MSGFKERIINYYYGEKTSKSVVWNPNRHQLNQVLEVNITYS